MTYNKTITTSTSNSNKISFLKIDDKFLAKADIIRMVKVTNKAINVYFTDGNSSIIHFDSSIEAKLAFDNISII
jgi:hypothetical protein